MRNRLAALFSFFIFSFCFTSSLSFAAPSEGEWVLYKVLRSSEWVPTAVDYVTITAGPRDDKTGAQWWQMVIQREKQEAKREKSGQFIIQALSDKVPMADVYGDIGKVYRYIFKPGSREALEYIDEQTGLAYLPRFGFREGLVPTPRSGKSTIGSFIGTGSYIGQPLTAQGGGSSGVWLDLGKVKKLLLNDDITVGTSRWIRDDGTGPGKDGEYKYIELDAEDYRRMIDSGFNLFLVNQKHARFVQDQPVFFVKKDFSGDRYPEMLYRSNYRGPTIYLDEPASRLDALDCRTVYDAVNLLRTRNRTYCHEPGSAVDAVVKMIQAAGYNVGDWYPKQTDVPVGETYYETAFYQIMGGATLFWHEGRYSIKPPDMLRIMFGPDVQFDTTKQSLDTVFSFLRGAARCFNVDWGMSIYGQADYSIAHEAVRYAYDLGARHVHFWTSDHDHHLPFERQLETARALKEHRKSNPRPDRRVLNRKAKVALAIPEGYLNFGHMMWWSNRFNSYRMNEYGVRYGDVMAEVWWNILKLGREGIDYDCVIDYPEIIDKAGYQKIIRVLPDGTTDLPDPAMPLSPGKVVVENGGKPEEIGTRKDAPVVKAGYAEPGMVKIDGDLREWKDAGWVTLEKKLVYDDPDDPWRNEDDLSAKAAYRYDSDALYTAVEVKDDIFSAVFGGDDIWKNDSVQIGFDPLMNKTEDGFYSCDDSELGFCLVDSKPYSHIWEQRLAENGPFKEAQAAVVRDGNFTRYEARIPLSSLPPLTPSFPGRCGMNIVVNDSDGDMKRKGALALASGLADGKYPGRWAVLEFEDSTKARNTPPSAWLKLDKPAVKKGEDLVFSMDTVSGTERQCELQVSINHGKKVTPPFIVKVKVTPGMNRYQVKLDTGKLEPESYYGNFFLSTGGQVVLDQKIKFYVKE